MRTTTHTQNLQDAHEEATETLGYFGDTVARFYVQHVDQGGQLSVEEFADEFVRRLAAASPQTAAKVVAAAAIESQIP